MNDIRVEDHVMDPPQTVYPRRALYSTFDVTKVVQAATPNLTLGVMLGNYKWGYTDIWCDMTSAVTADDVDLC